jgi:N-methylhydantoinase B/oxoprolinase/acetone carboxylase alpha subunit
MDCRSASFQRLDYPKDTVTLSAAELQILNARLAAVAEEMGSVLRRSAFSPNIKERADCSAAVFTAGGELLAQAEHIPVHLGSMPASVRAVIDAGFGDPAPREHFIVNDPYAGGTHLNDITLVTPVHQERRLIAWVANRAHHSDVGGMTPGSIPANAREIFQEGFRIAPIRYTDEVRSLIASNSRTPAERMGDLDAQLGANVFGMNHLSGFDPEIFPAVLEYGERRMIAALRGLPQGEYAFEDFLDSFGPEEDQRRPVGIRLRLLIGSDSCTFDFSESDDQVRGNINAPKAVTESAVSFALRSVLDPTLPRNGGVMRPISVVTRPGSVVDAEAPAAAGAGNVELSQRLADVCLGALAQAVPARVAAASQGTMNNVLIGGSGWVYYETLGGGQGARPTKDGNSAIHTGMTNTENTPIEALERAFPMRILRYEIRTGSGGGGRRRGGDGLIREIEFLDRAVVSIISERRISSPWGLEGGHPGRVGKNILIRRDSGGGGVSEGEASKIQELPDKVIVEVQPGDVLRIETPGGGGFGSDQPFAD